MAPKRRNNKGRKGRKSGPKRGGQSEGAGRKATTSVTVGLSVNGNQGLTFSCEQLLRKYFQDPRLVRINGYRIRISILDIQQPFLQYQVLCVTDNIAGPFVCMTQPMQITNNKSVQSVRIARDRSYWISSADETPKILDIKFFAFAQTKIVVEVTTFFNIEQDLVNDLALVTFASEEYEDISEKEITALSERVRSNVNIKRIGTPQRPY